MSTRSHRSRPNPNMLRFGKVTLDLDRRILFRGGRVQHLSEEYWKALVILVERRPNTVGKDELSSVLGGSTHETLAKQIGLIRKALGDKTEPYQFIRSERKRGYRFIAVPDEVAAEPKPPVIQRSESPKPQLTRWAPLDRKPPGICVDSGIAEIFIPWSELEREIKERLLPQVRLVPLGCTVSVRDFIGKENWIIGVLDPAGEEIANLWFGPNPLEGWGYDGLVRLGPPKAQGDPPRPVVWEVFQRYSDGSYRRIKRLVPG